MLEGVKFRGFSTGWRCPALLTLLHQQWLCGSVTCPRSGRLGQPQAKVVGDGGKRGEFLSKVELWVKEERERRRRRGELPLRGQSFSRKFGRKLIVRMIFLLLFLVFCFEVDFHFLGGRRKRKSLKTFQSC